MFAYTLMSPGGIRVRTIICLYFPRFPVQVEVRRRPGLHGRPFVIANDAQEVLWASAEAERAGVRSGMPCRQGIALCRDLTVIAAEPAAYREAWDPVVTSLEAFSPHIESLRPGLAFLDMTGTPLLRRKGDAAAQDVIDEAA